MKLLNMYKPYCVEDIYACRETVEVECKGPAGTLSFTYDGAENGSVFEGTIYLGRLSRSPSGEIKFLPDNDYGKRFYSDVNIAFHLTGVFWKNISGKFAVLSDGREVHYTRFFPALNAVKMWGLSISAALTELYGGKDITTEDTFPEGPKLAHEYVRRWNELKRENA